MLSEAQQQAQQGRLKVCSFGCSDRGATYNIEPKSAVTSQLRCPVLKLHSPTSSINTPWDAGLWVHPPMNLPPVQPQICPPQGSSPLISVRAALPIRAWMAVYA